MADDDDRFREEQFILRVPDDLADVIRQRIAADNFDGLEIDIPGGAHHDSVDVMDIGCELFQNAASATALTSHHLSPTWERPVITEQPCQWPVRDENEHCGSTPNVYHSPTTPVTPCDSLATALRQVMK